MVRVVQFDGGVFGARNSQPTCDSVAQLCKRLHINPRIVRFVLHRRPIPFSGTVSHVGFRYGQSVHVVSSISELVGGAAWPVGHVALGPGLCKNIVHCTVEKRVRLWPRFQAYGGGAGCSVAVGTWPLPPSSSICGWLLQAHGHCSWLLLEKEVGA